MARVWIEPDRPDNEPSKRTQQRGCAFGGAAIVGAIAAMIATIATSDLSVATETVSGTAVPTYCTEYVAGE